VNQTTRFVHYSGRNQPVLLGVSTVSFRMENGKEEKIVGHSFDINKLSLKDRESISWGIGFLLSNNEPVVILEDVETRRAQ